mmetsp:Transcript_15421/g.24309  ORF Transcript_15421/g.24309 Transcript_15421/m.24309 type:complete len:240 (+) Transcript_15421:353-1072(+)
MIIRKSFAQRSQQIMPQPIGHKFAIRHMSLPQHKVDKVNLCRSMRIIAPFVQRLITTQRRPQIDRIQYLFPTRFLWSAAIMILTELCLRRRLHSVHLVRVLFIVLEVVQILDVVPPNLSHSATNSRHSLSRDHFQTSSHRFFLCQQFAQSTKRSQSHFGMKSAIFTKTLRGAHCSGHHSLCWMVQVQLGHGLQTRTLDLSAMRMKQILQRHDLVQQKVDCDESLIRLLGRRIIVHSHIA